MARIMRLIVIMVLFITALVVSPAMAGETEPDHQGDHSEAAVYQIYLPKPPIIWNGDLIIYAHGYVNPYPKRPPEIPIDQLYISSDDPANPRKFIPDLVTAMGFAFATTSYSKNGLAVVDGVADVCDLVKVFKEEERAPRHVYLGGVSEGGLITTLALEQHPDIFSGGLALCAPIGDFRRQVNYWGDFRVIFDYFFPTVLRPYTSPIHIPVKELGKWYTDYVPNITAAISNNPGLTRQLLKVTGAPTDPGDPASPLATTLGILWYNFFATNDGKETLGGQPFDNRFRFYVGSKNDFRLNIFVQRFKANPAALAEIKNYYQTSGKLGRPLVSMHNTADPITPFWHEPLYLAKLAKNGSLLNCTVIPVFRYGHVNLKDTEVLAGFDLLVKRVTGQLLPLSKARSVLKEPKSMEKFLQLRKEIRDLK